MHAVVFDLKAAVGAFADRTFELQGDGLVPSSTKFYRDGSMSGVMSKHDSMFTSVAWHRAEDLLIHAGCHEAHRRLLVRQVSGWDGLGHPLLLRRREGCVIHRAQGGDPRLPGRHGGEPAQGGLQPPQRAPDAEPLDQEGEICGGCGKVA
jgi:hypothetical protein